MERWSGCRYERGGVHLPALGLWLDPHEPKTGPERVLVSHAHSDHIEAHREVILSPTTAKLMAARLPGERLEHRLDWGTAAGFEHEGRSWRITLTPAGHILGSAMALVEWGGESLLYTGDFKLRPGRSAERCRPLPADTLIMETTYGRPAYRFPPTEDVIAGIVAFCREALANDETPVLLGYSLGKSQEMLTGLADAGLPIALTTPVARLTRVYESCGQVFPPHVTASAENARGRVLLAPPGANLNSLTRLAGPLRTAVLTGWALDPGCRFRYQADAAFPLSDHADFDDLIELVRQVRPRRVLTLHGFAAEFAATLRELGWDAWALSQDEQLTLTLGLGTGSGESAAELPAKRDGGVRPSLAELLPGPAAAGSWAAFARATEEIRATPSKLEKIARLAAFLRRLDDDELEFAVRCFAGRTPTLQVGWSAIQEAVRRVLGSLPGEFRAVYLKHSDTAETVGEMFAARGRSSRGPTIAGVAGALEAVAGVKGPTAKVPLLVALLDHCDAGEARALMKVLTGDLRIGLKEGLVEEALAQAFDQPPDRVRRAHLMLGNIGETARRARSGRLAEAGMEPFRPVKVMLASPEPDAPSVWTRVGEWTGEAGDAGARAAWVEDKYDGIRCQVHKVGGRVELYSRDLKEVTASFPEVRAAVAGIRSDVVLDAELVAMRGDRALPFADLQRRLGRIESDLFLGGEVPVQLMVFDLLWVDGISCLDEPLERRRARMEALTPWPEGVRMAAVVRVGTAEEIDTAFTAARARGNEGLIIKDPGSAYAPGRRGLAWLKLKKAYATLDCVVVAAEYGHGKRREVLSDYTFAVRDGRTGELKTIGKAYSGLTDAEIAQLTAHFLGKVRGQRGRRFEVEPDTVLEIAFDRLQPSRRHASGLAMRFPRIVRIRDDKTVADIDTLDTAWALAGDGAAEERGPRG